MTPVAILFVLLSALFHSAWNFLSKRGNWPLEFYFMVFLSGTLFYIPIFIMLGACPFPTGSIDQKLWLFSSLSGFVQTVYFICLIKAYRVGDLSLIYPISRSYPLLTQIWATLLIGEILSIQGAIGILLVTFGIFVMFMRNLRSRSVMPEPNPLNSRIYLYAFAAVLTGSFISLIDKVGLQLTRPIYYTWFINFWMAVYTGGFILFRKGGALAKIWQDSKREILVIAALQNLSYFSFMMALQMSKVGYAVAFRQVGVLFGAIMGVLFLKERHWKTRMAGALILALGLVLIGLAR